MPTCFVIAPIGDADSPTRKRSDKILNYVVTPVLNECGYSPAIRADKISAPGVITHQIIKHVTEDDLVIADLTGANPNVFYELAIRHMVKRPLVQIIEKGERIPFDVASSRTIYIDHKDLDSVDAAKRELRDQIAAVEKDPNATDNPISVAVDLAALRSSTNPQERMLGETKDEIVEIKKQIVDLRSQIDHWASLKHIEKINRSIEGLKDTLDGIDSNVGSQVFYDLDDVVREIEELKEALEKG